ncbi:hypothetical protein RJ639_015111 [Escallonia herrerae]|uniref:Uncharacterized protein n=1 Tax=Escallonia herrerae TaxID=1293975 RepID=A0AA89AM26_9ASTE|nr:hypothetical protein RJ639_015111 [Escallonia herrerae]
MADTVAQQISLFRFQIENRRFDDGALRILESALVFKDVRSLLEVQSSLREFMRRESLVVLREISDKSVEDRLLILEFLVRAFALIRDSCLALRYEALLMREANFTSNQWLQVLYGEWLNFAEDSFANRFYSIARKACEKALSCFDMFDTKTDAFVENLQAIDKIKRLMGAAVVSAASRSGQQAFNLYNMMLHLRSFTPHWECFSPMSKSVQAQAAEYMNRKSIEWSQHTPLVRKEEKCLASAMFRDGIKNRNLQKLQEHRCLQQITSRPQC